MPFALPLVAAPLAFKCFISKACNYHIFSCLLNQSISHRNFGKSASLNHSIIRKLCVGNSSTSQTVQGSSICSEVFTQEKERAMHQPAMLREAIDILKPSDDQLLIDMTFGSGGHTKEILRRAPRCRVIVLDRDPLAFNLAKDLAKSCKPGQLIPFLGKFSDLPSLLSSEGFGENSIDGILFDVGVSSMQFDMSDRGFSLSRDGPLDMRMDGLRDPNQLTAADVVNYLEEAEIYSIIKHYGEERLAKHIAHAIVEARYAFGKITRTKQLADIIAMAYQGSHKRDKLMRHAHVATKTFQALRIFVNDELNELNNGLESARYFLKPGGRCAVISFHSLEDRIVKRHFHGIVMDSKVNMNVSAHYRNSMKIHSIEEIDDVTKKNWEPISKKVISPCTEDTVENPRVRSAKLRGAIKL